MMAIMRPPLPLMLEPEDILLAERLRQLAESYTNALILEQPGALVDPLLGRVLGSALRGVAADEGTVWLASAEEGALIPIWNNGPDASRFVGSFRLPLSEGISGMVFATGLSACEAEVCFQKQQHRQLDESLGVLTWAMLAVPLKFLGEVRGVITAVKLVRFGNTRPLPSSRAEWPGEVPIPSSFSLDDLSAMEHTTLLAGRLMEHRLKCWALNDDA